MRILRLLILSLLTLGAARADVEVGGIVLRERPQDLVHVTREEWAWGGGPTRQPVLSVDLKSGRFYYRLRHDLQYGNGQIGLERPSGANWYQAGMLDLLLDGQRFDLLPANGETVTTGDGRRGWVRFAWEDARARVAYTFVLRAGEDRLYLSIDLEPKAPLQALALRLMNYPSGFNRQPQHALFTPAGELAETGKQTVDVAAHAGLFLSDAALDPADEPQAAGPSAVAWLADSLQALEVQPGGYGVPMAVTCRPDARRVVLCFWEFARTPNAEALAHWRESLPAALAAMRDPATFATGE